MTPPVAVSGLTAFGVPLSDLLIVATLIYTVINIALVGWKLYDKFKSRGREQR